LDGLVHGRGPGAELVAELREAVRRVVDVGHTVTRSGPFWERVAEHLHPGNIGKREGKVLLERLRSSNTLTREHLDHLSWHGSFVERTDEAEYLRAVRNQCSAELAKYLAAIDAYEALCRPVAEA